MTLAQYYASLDPDIEQTDLNKRKLIFNKPIPGVRQAGVVPPPTISDYAPEKTGVPMAEAPLGTGSKLMNFQPQGDAQSRLAAFLQRGVPSGVAPMASPPQRDFAQEGRQGLNSALIAGAFGLGLGGPGTAPRLVDYALRGNTAGYDQRFQQEQAQSQLANQQAQTQAQAQRQQSLDELRGLQIGANLEQDANQQASQSAYQQDTLAQREEQAGREAADRSLAAQDRQDRTRQAGEASLRDDRAAFISQLTRLDPASQQAMLDQAERSGELMRLGADKLLARGQDGKWVPIQAAPREFSPMQNPEFVALRDRARRLADELKNPQINPAYKDRLSQELALVEAKLGVGTGQGLPQDAFLPMTPYQQSQQGLGERRQSETERRNRAQEVLQREGIDLREQGMAFEMTKWLSQPKKGTWESDGIKDVNKVEGEIASLYSKVARLRSGRTQMNPITQEMTTVPPSQADIDAASEIQKSIDYKIAVQEAIAGRYGFKRDADNRGWVRISGGVSPRTLPPLPGGIGDLRSYEGRK